MKNVMWGKSSGVWEFGHYFSLLNRRMGKMGKMGKTGKMGKIEGVGTANNLSTRLLVNSFTCQLVYLSTRQLSYSNC